MSGPGPRQVARRLVGEARDALHLWRATGIARAFGPLDLFQVARDALVAPRRGALAVVHAHALAHPDRPALVAGAARRTYAELDERATQLTHALTRLGVRSGDRVALFLRNGLPFFEVHVALSALGAVGVHVGSRLKADEVAHVLADSGARALFFDASLVAVVEEALARPGVTLDRAAVVATSASPGFTALDALLAPERGDVPASTDGEGMGGVMLYTSGTTGPGKGARRDLGAMGLAAVLGALARVPIRTDERHLAVCPLYHALSAMFVAPILALGGCVVVLERFEPVEVLEVIARERVTSALLVPTMLSRLLALPTAERDRHDLSSLRWVLSGAAPLPTEVARATEDWLGPVLYNLYGATETGLVTLALPGEHTARPGTIGRPLADNELRLLDRDGGDVADGAVGELYVRNGMLMDGYHGDEAATRAVSRDGFLSVGDLARRDGDGYYYLADRKSDLVISGGVNIYPWEIEQRLHQHPGIAEAAVAGVPDAEWGESLVAWVVPRAGAAPSAEALVEFVRSGLADYKKPRHVVFLDALPRNPTGKVLKRELRERWAAGRAS